jgi:hypothetical protein
MRETTFWIYFWWLQIPYPIKVAIWAAGGIGLAYVAFRLSARSRARWVSGASFLAVYVLVSAAIYVAPEYQARREQWLAQKCREVIAAQEELKAKPVAAEGFLVAADFDRLRNERFQRVAEWIRQTEGTESGYVVDLGRYDEHPVMRAMGAGTFAATAMKLLTEKRLSYVEFEMTPQGGKEYSNAGRLNTDGWSGKRYRLYYLAPHGDINCVGEAGEFASSTLQAVIGRTGQGIPPTTSSRPFCLALDITTTPISRHRLTADERGDIVGGMVRPRDMWLPALAYVRWDRLEVEEIGGKRIRRYQGFSYPDELNRRHACHDRVALANFINATFEPDAQRTFLHSKRWYEGSAVQRFYEPEKALAASQSQLAPQSTTQTTDACPARRPRDGSIVVDQLNDFSRAASSTEVTTSQQRASFFTLDRDATIAAVEWSGMVWSKEDTKQPFLVRVFRDANGLPGEEVYETEVTPSTRSVGRFSGNHPTLVFSAKTGKLSLRAGDYWLMISPPIPSDKRFFWTAEPGSPAGNCGSGGAFRWSPGRWQQIDSSVPARNAPGFSFRLIAAS